MPTVTERIESVKAGIVGAGAFSITELIVLFAEIIIPVLTLNPSGTIIDIAIGAISGFLFGVTYRYIIRGDRNSHLNDGAVFAFGLVRGLALVENNLVWSELLFLMFTIIQSIIYFAVVRFILDLAIARKLIKPFL